MKKKLAMTDGAVELVSWRGGRGWSLWHALIAGGRTACNLPLPDGVPTRRRLARPSLWPAGVCEPCHEDGLAAQAKPHRE